MSGRSLMKLLSDLLTAADVQEIVDAATSDLLTARGRSEDRWCRYKRPADGCRGTGQSSTNQPATSRRLDDVRKLVFTGEELTPDDVQKIVDASIAGQLTVEDVQRIISESQITLADLKGNTDAAMMGQVESSSSN